MAASRRSEVYVPDKYLNFMFGFNLRYGEPPGIIDNLFFSGVSVLKGLTVEELFLL